MKSWLISSRITPFVCFLTRSIRDDSGQENVAPTGRSEILEKGFAQTHR